MLKVKLFKSLHIVLFSILANYCFAESSLLIEEGNQSVFEKANELYEKEQFSEALLSYKSVVEKGAKSENLYYNLANTYYKTGAKEYFVL